MARFGPSLYRMTVTGGAPYEVVIPRATYAPWNSDAEFQALHEKISDSTLVDLYRCFELWQLIPQVAPLDGILIEVGVWRGGTGAIIASQAKQLGIPDKVYLCDTFAGVVKAGPEDNYYQGGEHSDTSRETVEQLLGSLSLDNVEILTGIFPDDSAAAIENEKVRFCHVDVDVYESARDVVEWVLPRLVPGGLIVFDDYGFKGCAGITRYADELRAHPNLFVVHNLNGHALAIKTG